MPLSNAEKQRAFRERNVVVLTADARAIAGMLIDMADQSKLKKIARFISDHLKHPDSKPARAGNCARPYRDQLKKLGNR